MYFHHVADIFSPKRESSFSLPPLLFLLTYRKRNWVARYRFFCPFPFPSREMIDRGVHNANHNNNAALHNFLSLTFFSWFTTTQPIQRFSLKKKKKKLNQVPWHLHKTTGIHNIFALLSREFDDIWIFFSLALSLLSRQWRRVTQKSIMSRVYFFPFCNRPRQEIRKGSHIDSNDFHIFLPYLRKLSFYEIELPEVSQKFNPKVFIDLH